LILQGPPSGFARQVGTALQDRGVFVRRVNLCLSDILYWGRRDAVTFRGPFSEWESYVEALIKHERIDCLLYFADRFPYHVTAQRVARRLGVQTVSYEFGYIRPDWIIVEHGGQSVYSHVPVDLAEIRQLAQRAGPVDLSPKYGFDFTTEAVNEVFFHLVNYFFRPFFWHYVADRPHDPLLEYLSYIPRLLRARRHRRKAGRVVDDLSCGGAPYFVAALQMQGDYQIRDNAAYEDLKGFIDEVVPSFAAHAPAEARLVFKLHPLDNGLVNLAKLVRRAAQKADVEDRVDFIDGGDLQQLLRQARGCVVINSTVGLQALRQGVPVKPMGGAVYDIPGLAFQGPLDRFWSAPGQVSREDAMMLVRLLAKAVHVQGDFYSAAGRKAGAEALADRLAQGDINGFGCYVDPPPRIAKALQIGIAVDPDLAVAATRDACKC